MTTDLFSASKVRDGEILKVNRMISHPGLTCPHENRSKPITIGINMQNKEKDEESIVPGPPTP